MYRMSDEFNCADIFKWHIMTHVSVKNFKSNECDRIFHQKVNLMQYIPVCHGSFTSVSVRWKINSEQSINKRMRLNNTKSALEGFSTTSLEATVRS